MRYAFLFLLLACACGDVASTHSSTTNSQDNSVDNSQHGISSCSQGSTLVCREDSVGNFTQTVECTNATGEAVVLADLEPVDDDIHEACPEPEAVIVESEV